MSQGQRILVGTIEIARHLYDFADGFRRLGYQVDTVISWLNAHHPDLHYDFTLNQGFNQGLFSDRVNRIRNPIIRYPRGLLNRANKLLNRSYKLTRVLYFLTAYDVYVFQWGGSLLPGNRDYPRLKRLGKKIISVFNGSDIRHWSAAEPAWQSFGLKLPSHFRERAASLSDKLDRLRMAEKYADVIFAQPSYTELAVRPYMHFYLPINLSLYDCNVPGRDVPVVVHAPSNRGTKGTEEILAALERLKAEGMAFELCLLEGKRNKEVIRQLVDADVVVDQLDAPSYGMLALEGMATGCAVAGGNRPGFIPVPPNRPILHIDSTNVYSQLRRLLTDKELRLRLAYQGRPFVEKYHDHVSVAQRMLECLELDKVEYDYYPTFFAREYRLPEGETIPEDLKRMTAEIVQRWGLPEDVDPQDMIARGLMSADGLDPSKPIPRWNAR